MKLAATTLENGQYDMMTRNKDQLTMHPMQTEG